jgi:two-component system response regulator HydG
MSALAEPIPLEKSYPVVSEEGVHVLVVDDQQVIRDLCGEIVRSLGYRVSTAADGHQALAAMEREHVDILLADLKMPGLGGLDLLERAKETSPQTEVVIMTAFGTVPSAVQAMKMGAYDYLTKPFNTEEVKLLLERIAKKLELVSENRVLREQVRHGGAYGQLLGSSPPMQRLYRLIAKVSQSHYPVLIQGESGTGKELVARSIHDGGPYAPRPFLPVDCGSLVPTLVESELFGYVRGAFTGAVRTKIGLFEAAQGGTVFLDEIGELTVDLQAKLLRSLQEKEIRPVGGTRRVKLDCRIIAATNRDLEEAVRQGTFRKDLFFRLNVVALRLPPLRERKTDIPVLVNHFLEKFRIPDRPRPTLSEEAMQRLMDYDWPGNVRELENCIERAVALGSGPILHSGDLATNLQVGGSHSAFEPVFSAGIGPAVRTAEDVAGLAGKPEEHIIPIAELERRAILRAISDTNGDKLLAARLLGIGKTTLYRKLKEYESLSHRSPVSPLS